MFDFFPEASAVESDFLVVVVFESFLMEACYTLLFYYVL